MLQQTTLGDLVSREERDSFVGRTEQLDVLERALQSERWPFNVLYVWGQAGIGKSALIERFARRREAAGVVVHRIGAALAGGRVQGLERLLMSAAGLRFGPRGLPAPSTPAGRSILWLDNYEAVVALETWLFDHVLRQLPSECLVCVTRRSRPPSRLTSQTGWSKVTRLTRHCSKESCNIMVSCAGR